MTSITVLDDQKSEVISGGGFLVDVYKIKSSYNTNNNSNNNNFNYNYNSLNGSGNVYAIGSGLA